MALVAAALLPHPKPLLVEQPAVDQYPKTKAGLAAAKKLFEQKNIQTMVVVSPSVLAPMHAYSFSISDPSAYHILGLDQLQVTVPTLSSSQNDRVYNNDLDLIRQIQERSRPFGLKIKITPHAKLDPITSGALHLLELSTERLPNIVSVMLPYLPPKNLFEFGGIIGSLAGQLPKACAVVGVGDLSARLTEDAPAGFSAEGQQFDDLVVTAAKKNDFMPLITADLGMLEKAGEEAARPLAVVAAATRNTLTSKLESYETRSGTGHAVLTWS